MGVVFFAQCVESSSHLQVLEFDSSLSLVQQEQHMHPVPIRLDQIPLILSKILSPMVEICLSPTISYYGDHQQKIPLHIYKYIYIYGNKIIVNFKIQATKYLQIQATSNTHTTTRNVYFTIIAMACKSYMGCRDYKNMYSSARRADYIFLRSLVIECGEYISLRKLYSL